MIEDFAELPNGTEIACDLCIVGAGAAGITIATALAQSGRDIVLLEGGGLEVDFDSQDLYDGENVGSVDYFPLTATRLRFFGGTTNHWSGTCVMYDPIDFAERPWIGESGWPLAHAEYASYLPAAAKLLDLVEPYDPTAYWDAFGVDLPAFDPAKLYFKTSQRTQPLRFGERFRDDLATAPRTRVLLNANVVDIVTTANADHVESVTLRSFRGTVGKVTARQFVVACGGIENARLLLASRSVEPTGLGNRHDLVGRFFADHPGMPLGEIVTADQGAVLDPIGGASFDRGGMRSRWFPLLTLSAELQERFELPNSLVYIYAEQDPESGVDATGKLLRAIKDGESAGEITDLAGQVLGNADDVAVAAWRRFVLGRRTIRNFTDLQLIIQIDPVPNPESRIMLGAELDPLGMPRIELDLRVSEPESRGIKIMGEVVGAELARLGLGRVRLHEWVEKIGDGLWYDAYIGSATAERFSHLELFGHHHHGTTRMASDPRRGVVDGDCKVHGIDNLHVAGSSTFPTPGSGNPTLSIVAFALRLAEHLREKN